MAIPSIPVMIEDGVFALADATGTPIILTLAFDLGNLVLSELSHGQRERIDLFDRNDYIGSRYGKNRPVGVSFSAQLINATDASAKLLLDAARVKGAFASAIATLPAASGGLSATSPNGVMTYSASWAIERTAYGGTSDGLITLKYFHIESAEIVEGDPTMINVKGVGLPFSTDYLTVT